MSSYQVTVKPNDQHNHPIDETVYRGPDLLKALSVYSCLYQSRGDNFEVSIERVHFATIPAAKGYSGLIEKQTQF